MILQETLKEIVYDETISKRDRILICLGVGHNQPKQVKEVVTLATSAGLREAKKWNISDILRKANGFAIRTDLGWELTTIGKKRVAEIAAPYVNTPVPAVASALRSHLREISDPQTKGFVEEAIFCFEAGQHRAAVVLSWIGAISLLQQHILVQKLSEFNLEASRRDQRWRAAKTMDDLGSMKEDTFLDILQAISLIGKNVKLELKKALSLRNGCGHPNTLRLAEHKVSAHIEDLMLNVYARFG